MPRPSFCLGNLLHVEGFQLGREAVQEDGRANDVRHLALSSLSDVIANLVVDQDGLPSLILDGVAISILLRVLDPVIVEPLDSVDVGEAHEGPRGWSEVGVELLNERGRGGAGEEYVNRLADLYCIHSDCQRLPFFCGRVANDAYDLLNVGHEVVEVDECELGLQMGVLAQMAARVAVLRAETLLHTKHISQARKACFEV